MRTLACFTFINLLTLSNSFDMFVFCYFEMCFFVLFCYKHTPAKFGIKMFIEIHYGDYPDRCIKYFLYIVSLYFSSPDT